MEGGQGTPLDQLDSSPGGSTDDDLVKRIFAEMHGGANSAGGQSNSIHQLPPAPSARAMVGGQLPPVNSLTGITMDPIPSTAHVIGSQHPTPADFAQAMHGMPMMMPPGMPQPGMMMPQQQQQQMYMQPMPAATGGFFSGMSFSLGRELKTPLLVALIVFIMGLPIINTMIGIYLPSLLRMGGDVTMLGLGVKSLLGGAFFWILQRVIAPLI
jgi:hypothetical protein